MTSSRLDTKGAKPIFSRFMTIPGTDIPFGTRLPDSLHAVSVSLPTIQDIIAYEEGDLDTIQQLKSGYPRFVRHELILKVEAHWQRLFDKPSDPVWLTSSESMARRLEKWLAVPEAKFQAHRGVFGLRIPNEPELNREAKLFLQHVGGKLSTRQAEDYLIAEGLLPSPYPEESFEGDAATKVIDILHPLLDCPRQWIDLANSGMNAFFAVFEAINSVQRQKGRNSWIKLGWLYADTMHILDKMSDEGSSNAEIVNIHELEVLEKLLETEGSRFAGIITETPTNPLVQSTDLCRIRDLATKHGIYLVLDPTTNSPANVDVSPYADVIVISATKYAANQGDVIMGAIAVNPSCPDAKTILEKIKKFREPVYSRDLRRLAAQIDGYAPLVSACNANTLRIVEYLESHPKVSVVYWAKSGESAKYYETIARSNDAIGSMISFQVDGELARFYDNLHLPKGPSFGLTFALVCPFIYLAHYDLIISAEGREQLARAGVSPELIRLSVGADDPDELISAFDRAFDCL